MKTLLSGLLILALAASANASITSWNCGDDGDGGIVASNQKLTGTAPDYTLALDGAQYNSTAHMNGWFQATPDDPNVWIIESVQNFTSFAWDKYEIYIGMPQSFTINPTAIAPVEWTYHVSAVQPGTIPGHLWPGQTQGYVAKITFNASSPLVKMAPGVSEDFGFKISFLGPVNFSTEQIGTPEPASMLLLAVGGLLLRRKR